MPALLIALALLWRVADHVMGTDDGSGFWYLLWSGFLPDIVLFAGLVTWVRHHRCAKDDCRYRRVPVRRLALRHYEGHLLCRHHHPARHRLSDADLAHLWRHHRDNAVLPHDHECAGGPAEAALLGKIMRRKDDHE